jgi:hypothetical protein
VRLPDHAVRRVEKVPQTLSKFRTSPAPLGGETKCRNFFRTVPFGDYRPPGNCRLRPGAVLHRVLIYGVGKVYTRLRDHPPSRQPVSTKRKFGC